MTNTAPRSSTPASATGQSPLSPHSSLTKIVCRFVVPILIVLGICGSLANLAIMSGSAFTGSTFYYLRALSLCDMFYLVCVIGTL